MKSIFLAVVLMAVMIAPVIESKKFNILSLDSATYLGLMTARFVSYMESKAYSIATEQVPCFKSIDDKAGNFYSQYKKIPMSKLFDMIAGSETGAIIAASISVPDPENPDQPRYFANRSVKWFEEHTDTLYRDNYMPWFAKFLFYFFLIGVFMYGIEYSSNKCLKVSELQKAYESLLVYHKLKTKLIK